MKQSFFLLLLSIAITFLHSCVEIGPSVNTDGGGNSGGDTTNSRVVLLEVFTAVQCVNCPAGREIIDELLDSFPGRIEVVEIHSGDLSEPINVTDPDFRSQAAEDITNYLGPFPFQPSAAIDRKSWEISAGNFERLVDRNFWNLFVRKQLDSISNVKLEIDKAFNTTSRELTVTLNVEFLQDVNDIINATILLTESGMIAAQDDGPTNVIEDYEHENVLRDFLTGYSGELINADKKAGSTWSLTRTIVLPAEWNANNCRVVALVAKSTGTYDVLQTAGSSIN